MKVGSVEGTPEEINDFFQNNGLNPFDFFEKPEIKLSNIWLIIPSLIFVCSLAILSFAHGVEEKAKMFIFLLGLCACCWIAVSAHIRFKSNWGAGSIIFIGLLVMLVAFGVLQPEQLPDYIKSAK